MSKWKQVGAHPLPRDQPLTITDNDGNELRLFIDSNGQVTHNGTPISLKLKYDDPNPNPDTDGYSLLEINPKQNTIQCENKSKILSKKVRCQYIKGHGDAHIYSTGKSELVNEEGKRTAKRGMLKTPINFKRGWK